MANRAQLDRARLSSLMAREQAQFEADHPRSASLFGQARHSLLDGVPMPWMVKWAGPFPPYVESAAGARFRCVDGHDYVDFCLGDTGAMAGHGPAPTIIAVERQLRRGIVAAETANLVKLNADLMAAVEAPAQDKAKAAIAKSEKTKAAAETKIKDIGSDRTSIMGLEKPLFELRNPGLISIPLGFLAVILGSLLYRDKRSDEMWDELYVRQNTGILAAKATAH
jgi:hypothetical protein